MYRSLALIYLFSIATGCITTSSETTADLVKRDQAQLENDCTDGNGAACFELVRRLELQCSKKFCPDQKIATDLHRYAEKGCALGNKSACHDLGWTYQMGIGTEKNLTRALELFEQVCTKDDIALGCTNVAYHYKEGLGVAVDYQKALFYSKKGCIGGNGMACCYIGQNYHFGQGVGVDYKLAGSYYDQSCSLGDGCGCLQSGFLIEKGLGVEADLAEAVRKYEKACRLKEEVGCHNVGFMKEKSSSLDADLRSAAHHYARACLLNEPTSCRRLAEMFYQGRGVTSDEKVAFKLLFKSCDLGNTQACGMYVQRGGTFAANSDSLKQFIASCDEGDYSSCWEAGNRLIMKGVSHHAQVTILIAPSHATSLCFNYWVW